MAMAAPAVSFVTVSPESHFSLQNLPYGMFRPSPAADVRPGVAIGDYVLDLSAISRAGLFSGPLLSSSECFLQTSLNGFMALGRPAWKEARATIQSFFRSQVKMELPAMVGDYTDFFSSKEHTLTAGSVYYGKGTPLPPNWVHVPIAYHGRASSVVVSGTDIVRPRGQTAPLPGKPTPVFGPSAHFDFELEMAMFVGPGNKLGSPVSVEAAADHIFGLVLMNDWSARDIQKWEALPLGPFLGKSFATTISPWIVTLEALEPFLCDAPMQDPAPLPYLKETNRKSYDIPLQVAIRPEGELKSSLISRSNFKSLYWTICQQLAHHTVNGCNLRTGDLLASGTISGHEPDGLSGGCLLEQSWGGTRDIVLQHGGTRKYLHDGDAVIITAVCQGDGFAVGFGECSGKVLPSGS